MVTLVEIKKFPIRKSTATHICCLCLDKIKNGGKYYDGEHIARRAHIECVDRLFTGDKTKDVEMVEITEGALETERIKSQYGHIFYKAYLEFEKQRILSIDPTRIVKIIKKRGGKISLWANNIAFHYDNE